MNIKKIILLLILFSSLLYPSSSFSSSFCNKLFIRHDWLEDIAYIRTKSSIERIFKSEYKIKKFIRKEEINYNISNNELKECILYKKSKNKNYFNSIDKSIELLEKRNLK